MTPTCKASSTWTLRSKGPAVNVQRQNAYQASQSIGVFLNEFMDSDVTITRPDGTTFTPATAETEADLRAALSIAKREFAAPVLVWRR